MVLVCISAICRCPPLSFRRCGGWPTDSQYGEISAGASSSVDRLRMAEAGACERRGRLPGRAFGLRPGGRAASPKRAPGRGSRSRSSPGAAQAQRYRGGEAFERFAQGVAGPGRRVSCSRSGVESTSSSCCARSCFQVDTSDQALAREHRQAVVPVAAPAGRLVDLYALLEVEQEAAPARDPQSKGSKGESRTPRSRRGRRPSSSGRRSRVFDPDPAGDGFALRYEACTGGSFPPPAGASMTPGSGRGTSPGARSRPGCR